MIRNASTLVKLLFRKHEQVCDGPAKQPKQGSTTSQVATQLAEQTLSNQIVSGLDL